MDGHDREVTMQSVFGKIEHNTCEECSPVSSDRVEAVARRCSAGTKKSKLEA
jgi:hypothetical protein